MKRSGFPRRRLFAALVILSLFAAAAASAARHGTAAYPGSIAVLGQSDPLAYGSDSAHPFHDAPLNSWATGTNPAVDSIYSRILALNPAVRGHNANFANDDAGIDDLAPQVAKAVKLRAGLVIIQSDVDVRCDGKDQSRVTEFGTALRSELATLTSGDPKVRVFLVSSWGSFSSYVQYLKGLTLSARLKHAGKGLCQFVAAPSGQVVPSHVAYVAKVVYAYDAELASVCRQVANCWYDGGAAQRMSTGAADISPADEEHLTLEGQAKLARTEWGVLQKFIATS
jgi:hypothetical protein